MRRIFAAAIFSLILVSFCSPLTAQTTQPVFLFSLESKGVPTGTVHVFSVNASTGALTEVPGSPFNAGLIPNQLVVDPTGRFVYVTNDQSEDITAFSVDVVTGALTELPGSPFPIGAAPVTSAIDPTGRFLYAFATNVVNGADEELLYEYAIDSATGVLIAASSSPTTWETTQGYLFASIAFDPAGNYAYLGQVAGGNLGAPTLVCSVDFSSGTLSPVGSVQPAVTGEANHVAVSPSGNFLYSINTTFSQADAFTIGSGGGSLSEISGSPYSVPYGPSSLVVHPSGNFLYVANSNTSFQAPPATGPVDGSIYAFSINSGTGALTQVSGSPLMVGINPLSIVVDPTGSFAYWTSTSNATGTPFAQIIGYSINASTGVLTPLSWTPWTDSVTSNGGQLVVSHGPITATNPVPMISSLSPSSTTAAGAGFTLQVSGANFVPGATVYFGGKPRSTTFVNSTRLDASILNTDIDNGGTAVVFVFDPLPGGGASTSVEFPVFNPIPVISSTGPSSVTAGANAFALFVIGSNFVTSSVVNFNGADLATSYSSPGLLIVEIFPAEILTPGPASVWVTSPSNGLPGGGTSNTVTLTILPPVTPFAVSNISPTSATAGGPAFTLTVNGSGFVQSSQVSFHLNNVSTTFVSTTQLTASIPASAIAIAGSRLVIVTNPDRSTSVPLTFMVNNPQPGGGSVTPPSLPAGSNALVLNVTGTGFVPDSVVLVGGTSRVTTYVSSTSLKATLLPSDLAQGGTLDITVMNPPPGGGTTAVISFSVDNPMPQESTLSPSSAQPGSAALTLNVIGSSFNTSSRVRVNGVVRTTTYVNSTSLQVAILASDMSQAGTLIVSVTNPTPGGGTTLALLFTIDDYTIAAPISSATVNAGHPAVFSLVVAPANGTYPNRITLMATGLPMDATDSFAPSATVTPDATPQTVTLSITTTPHTAASTVNLPHGSRPVLPLLCLAGLAFALAGFWLQASGAPAQRLAPQLFLALLIVTAAGLAACGAVGVGPSSPPQLNPATGTPAGDYMITVTATSGGVSHSTSVTLTVM